ncbi:hypothetical protein D3C80_1034910 [compost metagenome]
METLQDTSFHYTVAEIQLHYTPKVNPSSLPKITSSHDAYKLLNVIWDTNKINLLEEFKVLLLNRSNRVLGIINLSAGGIDATVVDLRLIFAAALKANASCIILAHNHPSGNLTESEKDRVITASIVKAGEIMNITVLDHLIITNEGYLSFSDKGLL